MVIEFENRRKNLFDKMSENSAAIIFSGVSKISSEDEYYDFVVNNNFYYLTGIRQEHSILLLVKGSTENILYLFIDEYDELKEKWTGKRLTFDEAKSISGIKNTYSFAQFESTLALVLQRVKNKFGKISKIYVDLTPEIKIESEKYTKDFVEEIKAKRSNILIEDVYPLIRDLRMVKSDYEIDCLSRAIEATNNGLNCLIKNLKEGTYEYELNSHFLHYGKTHGKRSLAFSTIVATGKNATCLHYPTQNDTIMRNDLVLFDLGYKDGGYSADITRTYPANGTYTGKARDIYIAVLNCNKAVIEHIRAGMTIADLQKFATEFLTKECIRLRLMPANDDIKKYYFHNVSHHLGLDTHDAADRNKPLRDGNVITVEPGLYFANYGIGVRIEDDIVIKDGKAICLSNCIAKEIPDIERLFKTRGF